MYNKIKIFNNNSQGFTLIEVLVAVAIIGLLFSVVLPSLNKSRAKARDTKAKSELEQVKVALYFYLNREGKMPTPPIDFINDYKADFVNIAQQLVDKGLLNSVPQAPVGSSYEYYDYGKDNVIGALLITSLVAAEPTYQPYPGTCRPWNAGDNWCDTGKSDTYYCLCNPY